MWRSLKGIVGLPAVVVLLLIGTAVLLFAAVAGGPAGKVLGVLLAIFIVFAALVLAYLTWIERMNADIDSDRTELKRQLDETLDGSDTEE